MPVVARLNSVLCACKSKQCRRRWRGRVRFVIDTQAKLRVFLRENQRSANEPIPREDTLLGYNPLPGPHNPNREAAQALGRSSLLSGGARGAATATAA